MNQNRGKTKQAQTADVSAVATPVVVKNSTGNGVHIAGVRCSSHLSPTNPVVENKEKTRTALFTDTGRLRPVVPLRTKKDRWSTKPKYLESSEGSYARAKLLLMEKGKHKAKPIDKVRSANAETLKSMDSLGEVVYFIRAGGMVKIGKAKNLRSRLSGMQCGCPFPMEILCVLPGYTELERQLHGKFREHRSHGEWFILCDEITAHIEASRPHTGDTTP